MGECEQLLELYPVALPEVYGYLLPRCGNPAVAEDLTAEVFMAAVTALQNASTEAITTGWLIVVARRRRVDHWRKNERDHRGREILDQQFVEISDPWDDHFDAAAVRAALAHLGPQQRAALTLRYLDGLSVAEVADYLGRTVHGAESLLQRARVALRRTYEREANRAD